MSWYDKDTIIEDKDQSADKTFVIEDPRYGHNLKAVTDALESLLSIKLCLTNINQMENLVKIILALCIDFSIKSQNIQENMLAMGEYIKELKNTKKDAGENKNEIARLEHEIKLLTEQLENMQTLYSSYREIAKINVSSDNVTATELLDQIANLREKVKKEKAKANRLELQYSQKEGRKNFYKNKSNSL